MKDFLHHQEGQSLVEFALILPILLLFLLGIMEFGRIFGGYLELQSTTRDLARYAAIHNITTSDGLYITDSEGHRSLINEHFVLLEPDKITVVVDPKSIDEKNKWVGVTLNYSMPLLTPYFKPIVGNPVNMESTMAMKVE